MFYKADQISVIPPDIDPPLVGAAIKIKITAPNTVFTLSPFLESIFSGYLDPVPSPFISFQDYLSSLSQFEIKWGDGISEYVNYDSPLFSHTYIKEGYYNISWESPYAQLRSGSEYIYKIIGFRETSAIWFENDSCYMFPSLLDNLRLEYLILDGVTNISIAEMNSILTTFVNNGFSSLRYVNISPSNGSFPDWAPTLAFLLAYPLVTLVLS